MIAYGEDDYPSSRLAVSPSWLMERLDDPNLRILDVRAPLSYRMGHIPNAVHFPYELILDMNPNEPSIGVPSKDHIEKVFGEYGIDEGKIVVIYGGPETLPACRLFWTLDYYGHPDVRILNLDFNQWARSGLKVTREVPKFERTRFSARPDGTKIADAEYVLSKLGDKSTVILDNRSPMEYFSEVPTQARPGRIPGSINLPHYTCTAVGRLFKRASELDVILKSAGVVPGREVVTYCHVGERAAHSYIALRLLNYPRVRLYVKSYSEWGSNPNLPVET